MLDLATIWQSEQVIRPYVRRTPLVYSAVLSELSGAEVWLKLENQQPTGSFKVRGALNKIGRFTSAERARGLVAASAGNHALGVAYAVQSLGGIEATIFVPETAPKAKVEKIGRFAVKLRLVGRTYEAAQAAAVAYAEERGAIKVSAYDDLAVIAGQATVGLEIFADLPQVETVIVPVGGGGIIAGVATVARWSKPSCRVVGVQPSASPAALLSLRDGQAYDPYEHEPTIADGLAGGFGKVPFAVAESIIDEIWLASEVEMRQAIFMLLDQHQLVVEASGAIGIVPLLQKRAELVGNVVVCVLTGGNLDTALLRDIVTTVDWEEGRD